jgi:hypothetical protein
MVYSLTVTKADSSSFRHLLQRGSTVNPSLKTCPFRWQCPVNSPTIHLSWSLLSFNRCLDLLAEGPTISSFACLSPVRDSHIWYDFCSSSPWPPSWQLQTRCHRLVQVLWKYILKLGMVLLTSFPAFFFFNKQQCSAHLLYLLTIFIDYDPSQ